MAAADGESQAVAAPYSTGGGGTVLEHRYGAVLLVSLLTSDPLPELGDDVEPVSVRFQASAISAVDDLLVTGRTPDGQLRRVSIGVRRAPRLVKSDEASARLLAQFVRTTVDHWGNLQAGRWRLCLGVVSPNKDISQLSALADVARASADDTRFRAEVARGGRVDAAVRRRLEHVDALVASAVDGLATDVTAAEITWRLLSSLWTRELRLEGRDQSDRTQAVRLLRPIAADRPGAADQLFSKLAELASGYAPVAAEVTRPVLQRDLSGTPLRSPSLPDAGEARVVTAWDPVQLGVHRAITVDVVGGQLLPQLTRYIERAHDRVLREVLAQPRRPVMAVLVGGSSTGKTRAAWEAVRECLHDWQMLCPVDATELMNELSEGSVPAGTVIWLNELQVFLQNRPDVAAILRRLLSGQQPVAVVGTMWPEFWKDFSTRPTNGVPDINYQARELLRQAVRIDIPEAFTVADRQELSRQQAADPRLAIAAATARSDGKITQVLAGGPELLRRYQHPDDAQGRYGNAVVTAAMDIRRLGHESPIDQALLEKVAAAYLGRRDRATAPPDWLRQALADATLEVHGIAALTANRNRPSVGKADGYVLHDYLDQFGRWTRVALPVPAPQWDALVELTSSPADRARLALEAQGRGYYRHAVALARPAAATGETTAMNVLGERLYEAGRHDEAIQWLQRSVELGNVQAVHLLTQRLGEAGDAEGAARVLRRAAEAGNGLAAMSLAARLDEAGDHNRAQQVVREAAEGGDTMAMQNLAKRLNEAGNPTEAEYWLRRASDLGDVMAKRSLADQLEQADGFSAEVEQLRRETAESGDFLARSDMVYLGVRLDEADRAQDAQYWWHRAALAGDSSAMWILAGRFEQAGSTAEAEQWRRLALDAGSPLALHAALDQIKQSSGSIRDFERLLRGSMADGQVIARLIEWFEDSQRGAEADQWLREAAESGNLIALHFLAGRAEQAGRTDEAEYWRRRLAGTGTWGGVYQVALQLEKTDPVHAELLRQYGLEPGGATADPW
jgi:TPR repeat protein